MQSPWFWPGTCLQILVGGVLLSFILFTLYHHAYLETPCHSPLMNLIRHPIIPVFILLSASTMTCTIVAYCVNMNDLAPSLPENCWLSVIAEVIFTISNSPED